MRKKITITDKEKEVVKMFMNRHCYEKLHEKAIGEAEDAKGESSIDDNASMNDADKATGLVIAIEMKLKRYQKIIDNKCELYGISEERRVFLFGLIDVLDFESERGGFSQLDNRCKEMLSSIEDQEYLNELRGYLKDIDNGEYPYDEEWYDIEVRGWPEKYFWRY